MAKLIGAANCVAPTLAGLGTNFGLAPLIGKRVAIKPFLKRAGYRVTKSLQKTNDVVLPTAGIESWIEIHNLPSQTEKLAPLLTGHPA